MELEKLEEAAKKCRAQLLFRYFVKSQSLSGIISMICTSKRAKGEVMKKVIPLVVIVLVVVAVFGAWSEGAEIGEAPPVYPEVPRISAYEARKLFTAGKLILANAHEAGPEFEKTRLVGAISLPNGEVQRNNPPLPIDVIVAFYCM